MTILVGLLQFRRGPTVDRMAKVFDDGEPIYDETEKAVYIGDGATAGGIRVTNDNASLEEAVNVLTQRVSTLTAADVGADKNGSAAVALASAIEYAATKVSKPVTPSDTVFARGDGQWINWINNDFRVGTATGLYGSGRELAISAGTTGDNIAHLSLQGNRTNSGIFTSMNYYHKDTLVASIGASRDGADDAGSVVITTKPTGAALANRVRVLSNGTVIIGTLATANGAGILQVDGNVVGRLNNSHDLGSSNFLWKDAYVRQIRPGNGTPIWTSGTGSPLGVLVAPIGSLYTRLDGGANTTLYVKESGTDATGWVAK